MVLGATVLESLGVGVVVETRTSGETWATWSQSPC